MILNLAGSFRWFVAVVFYSVYFLFILTSSFSSCFPHTEHLVWLIFGSAYFCLSEFALVAEIVKLDVVLSVSKGKNLSIDHWPFALEAANVRTRQCVLWYKSFWLRESIRMFSRCVARSSEFQIPKLNAATAAILTSLKSPSLFRFHSISSHCSSCSLLLFIYVTCWLAETSM